MGLWIYGINIFGLEIRFYGILMATAFVVGLFLVRKLCKLKGFDENMPYDLLLIAFPSAIVGARINYVLFTLDRGWTFAEILSIWHGGLMIYGGVLFSVIAIWIYCHFKKISFLSVIDMLAPVLILGQAIGRWGNFFNQEAYGSLITNPAFQWFPFGVYIENSNFTPEAREQVAKAFGASAVDGAWFNATFFYESLWCAIGFVLLYLIYTKTNKKGLCVATYFAYYGFERFFVEMLRTDSLYLGNIKISVLVSAILFIAGVIWLLTIYIKDKRVALLNDNGTLQVKDAKLDKTQNLKTKKVQRFEEFATQNTEQTADEMKEQKGVQTSDEKIEQSAPIDVKEINNQSAQNKNDENWFVIFV